MIRIQIDDLPTFRKKYLKRVANVALARVNILLVSLKHLNGVGISTADIGYLRYKHITRKIINTVEGWNLPESDFDTYNYVTTVTNYVKSPNNLLKINLKGLFDLMTFLTQKKGANLKDLLICLPDQLKQLNKKLLSNYKVDSVDDRTIIKLGFNYDLFKDVSNKIKTHFRVENLVLYCPYCNIGEADYSKTEHGTPATIHYLDHFFDKASYPLLCYSAFNLVPGDNTCNSTINKGGTNFDDKFHLNPYIKGFSKTMVFEPILGKIGSEIAEIHLNIKPVYGSTEYRQLIGKCKKINEASKFGNINVFKLRTKYNRSHVRKNASHFVDKVYELISSRSSLNGFLTRMGLAHSTDNYKKWYEWEAGGASFDEKNFNNHPYSKLFRDLHDDVLTKDTNPVNDDIRAIMSKS